MLVVARPWDGGPAGEQVSRWLGGAVLVLLPGAVGIYVRTRAQLLAALRERAERAEAEQELLARDAVLDRADPDRARDARRRRPPGEPHGAAGRRDRDGRGRPRPGRSSSPGSVQTAGRQALDELRQMVGVLRAGEDEDAPLAPQPGLDDAPRAGRASRGRPGMAVELTGAARRRRPLDPAVGRAAYRIVQEALTNAGKHAPGARGRASPCERPAGRARRPGASTAPATACRGRCSAAGTAWWGWLSGCAPSAAG